MVAEHQKGKILNSFIEILIFFGRESMLVGFFPNPFNLMPLVRELWDIVYTVASFDEGLEVFRRFYFSGGTDA